MLPASPMFSLAFRCNVQRALLNGVRGGRRQPLWVQRLRGSEALGAAAAHPEHPMMREMLNECANGHLDLHALAQLLSDIHAGQVRVYEVHTGTPLPLCLNLRRQVEAEMMYETAIPSAATALSRDALLTLTPTREAVESASRPMRAPRSADELHARLMAEGDLLAEEADAPAEWMDALELTSRAVYIESGLWIARENEAEYRRALEEADAPAFVRIVRRAARFHGAQTAETLSERYAVEEARAQDTLNALLSEGILRRLGDAYIHAELYESAQRMTVVLNRRRVETQPARAFARMLSQQVRGVGSSSAQLTQALNRLRGCEYPASAWEGWLLPARVSGYRPQLLDEALARGEFAYRVLPAEPVSAKRTPHSAEPACRIPYCESSQISDEAACRTFLDEASQTSSEPCIHGNAAHRVPSGEASQIPAEAACRVLPTEAPQISAVAARRTLPAEAHISAEAFCRIPSDGCPRGAASRSALGARAQANDTGMPNRNAASGKAGARAVSGERARVRFDWPDDEGEYEPLPNDLTDTERAVLQTLTLRGASFASRLPTNAGDALKTLLARGLVRADSFLPVREMLAAESASVKKTMRRRVRVMDAGRWSRVGAPVQADAETQVERLFDRFGIVCRETAGADWNAALDVLKHMEYAGTARRGYFVKGLSGAQFVREADFASITARLRQPSDECIWLAAADPMQAWGAYLAHEESRAFLRVPGTTVALLDGAVVALSEKQGETPRILDEVSAPAALRTLADAFRHGQSSPRLPG